MSVSVLDAMPRGEFGSNLVGKLRKQDLVPGVINNQQGEPGKAFSVKYLPLLKLMNEGCFLNTVIELKMDGKKLKVLPTSVSSHPVDDKILHVEMLEVDPKSCIRVKIPVLPVGKDRSEAIKRGAVVNLALRQVKVKCNAGAIPRAVMIDITEMNVGDKKVIGDLSFPKDITPLHHDKLTVLNMIGKKAKAEKAEEAASEEKKAE